MPSAAAVNPATWRTQQQQRNASNMMNEVLRGPAWDSSALLAAAVRGALWVAITALW
jgi:hypothetical protein